MASQGRRPCGRTGGSKGNGRDCGPRCVGAARGPRGGPAGPRGVGAPGRAGVCGVRRCEGLELLQHGGEDVPRGVELLGAHEVRVVGGEHLEQQPLVGLGQLALEELGRVEQVHAHLLHLEVQPRHLVLHLLDQRLGLGCGRSSGWTPRAAALCTPSCNPRVCARLPVDGLLGLQPHDQLVARAVRERADDAGHGVELDAHLALLVAERLARLQQGIRTPL